MAKHLKKVETIEDAVKRVIEIDNDDELYLQMLNEPIFNEEHYISETFKNAEEFLVHIFDQPIEKAGRRSKVYWPKGHEEFLVKATKTHKLLYKNKVYLFFKNLLRKIR